jgi:hypothetical protein
LRESLTEHKVSLRFGGGGVRPNRPYLLLPDFGKNTLTGCRCSNLTKMKIPTAKLNHLGFTDRGKRARPHLPPS